MKSMDILINYINDITGFINEARKVEGPVLVKRDSYCVDGTSILGMFSLDSSKPLTVEYPEDAVKFEQYIKQFEINR